MWFCALKRFQKAGSELGLGPVASGFWKSSRAEAEQKWCGQGQAPLPARLWARGTTPDKQGRLSSEAQGEKKGLG